MEVAMVLELQMNEGAQDVDIQDLWSLLNSTLVFCHRDTIGVPMKDHEAVFHQGNQESIVDPFVTLIR